MNRFQFHHHHILSRDFILKSQVKNVMKVPILSKIVLNTSIKSSSRGTPTNSSQKGTSSMTAQDKNRNLSSLIALEMICGQKLKKTRSKKFIAGFKLRKGELIACKVTLRGNRMFSFFEKLVLVVLPKLRDFQGLGNKETTVFSSMEPTKPSIKPNDSSKYFSFDNHGNISFGLQNFLLFPELENHYELFESLTGFQITLVTNANNHQAARLLLSGNQMPF
jgi:large subunit ribosomal protein L5